MMQISTDTGKLNRRITFQYKPISKSREDEVGYQNTGWQDFYSCWAAVHTASGSESWQNGERVQENVVAFKVRACKRLAEINTTEFRIAFGDRYYDIVAIDDMLFAGSLLNIRTIEKKPLAFVDGIAGIYSVGESTKLNLTYEANFNYEKIANVVDHEATIRIALDRNISVVNLLEIDGEKYEITQVEHDKESLPPTTKISVVRLGAEPENVVLVSPNYVRDEIGQISTGEEQRQEIFCIAKSITQSEWDVARQNDFQAEWKLEVFSADYAGQRIAVFREQRYVIYRTFCNGEKTELYLGLRIGELDG